MTKQLVVITIVGTVNQGVGMRELRAFAADAVGSWGGQRHPGDPLFDSVEVTSSNVQRIGKVESQP